MDIDVVIIGGGIVGILTALELKSRDDKLEVALVEKNGFLGEGSSSRNSGVLHAGIYYPTNSLKHLTCLAGNKAWREIAKKYSIEILNCGKYIVASSKEDLPILEEYFSNAKKNQVPEISKIPVPEEMKEFVNAEGSFFSGTTAIVDVSDAIRKLETAVYNNGVHILKNSNVTDLKIRKEGGFSLKINSDEVLCEKVINCAGHYAPVFRKDLGLDDVESYLVKGHYVKVSKKYYSDHLIYPVPQKNLKGLGVHTSFDVEGNCRFGPDTFDVESVNYSMESDVIDKMYPEIKKIFKQVEKSDLQLDYCGVRSKIKHNGKLYTDFWIKGEKELGIKGYVEALGIESPGFTASPAIAKMLAAYL